MEFTVAGEWTVISKQELLGKLAASGLDRDQVSQELEDYDEFALCAAELQAAMPGVGFLSVKQRMNCFMAVCRHLDEFVDRGRLTVGQSQYVLMILRLSDKKFEKAIGMFDIRGSRYGTAERADMPRSAREYLAGLEYFR